MEVAQATVFGALAIELAPGIDDGIAVLSQAQAGVLAAVIGRDLSGFAAEAASLDCTVVGAHYDPVELLRPGWPLHGALLQLAANAPRGGSARDGNTVGRDAFNGDAGHDSGRVIAFGAYDGALPGVLAPSPDHGGGPLRLLPFLLSGDAGVVARVSAILERDLMESGMAGAETALIAQDAFGLRIEHARYLTVHDLCALTAMQYEHAGLAPLWPLLETALLSPAREAWLDAPPEPLLHYANGEARMALFSPDAWRTRYAPADTAHDTDTCTRLTRVFEHYQARQRQLAAVLQAHGVPVLFVQCDGAGLPAL